MKIAIFITGLEVIGGAETQVVSLSEYFASYGHDILLVSLTGELNIRPLNPHIRVHCLNMRKSLRSLILGIRKSKELLRSFSPDVVHSHMVHANIFARLLRMTTSINRLICTAHSQNEGGVLRIIAYRMTDSLADITTNVSKDAVAEFIRRGAVPKEKITVAYNGIDCNRFFFDPKARNNIRLESKLPEKTKIILAVGRLTQAKDYKNLLHAFAAVSTRNSNCILWIVGIGDEKLQLETLATKLEISSKVAFLGFRQDIPALMSAADLFVLSSSWEGFGLVVAEAMACERPVIATNAGGVREVMGNDGWLVPIKNSELLAQTIDKVINLDKDILDQYGKAGRKRIQSYFSLKAATTHWLNIYKNSNF